MHHTYRLLNIDDYEGAGPSLSGYFFKAQWARQRARDMRGEKECMSHTQTISFPSLLHRMLTVMLLPLHIKSWQTESSQYYLITIPTVDMQKKRPEKSQDLKIKVVKGRLRPQQLCGMEKWCVSHHVSSGGVSHSETLGELLHTNNFKN